jgi:glycerophosphoryl diester phosphodiesterase
VLLIDQIIIGHRGASGHAPENTILSFRRALEFGAQMIELDIHETLDGRLVCIHDTTLDRTTNGSGEVNGFTYEELLDFNAGEGEQIPLLEDVLKFASGNLQVNIELKVLEVEKQVLDIVERYEMFQDVIISSFSHDTLSTIRSMSERAPIAILVDKPKEDLVSYAVDFRANAINPQYQFVTSEFVQDIHNAGLKIYPWTVNDQKTMKDLFTLGIDGLITDFPDRAVDILRTFA